MIVTAWKCRNAIGGFVSSGQESSGLSKVEGQGLSFSLAHGSRSSLLAHTPTRYRLQVKFIRRTVLYSADHEREPSAQGADLTLIDSNPQGDLTGYMYRVQLIGIRVITLVRDMIVIAL